MLSKERHKTRQVQFTYPLSWIAFSTYDLGEIAPYALAVRYTPPNRKNGLAQRISLLAPVEEELISHVIVAPNQKIMLVEGHGILGSNKWDAPQANHNGRLLPKELQRHDLRLSTEHK